MTIRSSINASAINRDFQHFETACESAPLGTFDQAKDIGQMIGEQCDAFLAAAKAMGLDVCNCDGIREIECMMFAMLREKNPDSQIEQGIGLGQTLNMHPESADRVITGLVRDRDFLASVKSR
jgi:hypothetical protein